MVPLGAKRQGETWGRRFGRTQICTLEEFQSFCDASSVDRRARRY